MCSDLKYMVRWSSVNLSCHFIYFIFNLFNVGQAQYKLLIVTRTNKNQQQIHKKKVIDLTLCLATIPVL